MNRLISFAARVCSPVFTPASSASTAAWVPHSPSATNRTWGNALVDVPLVERPNARSLSLVSGTSRTSPSMAITRRPRYHAPRVPARAIGTATR
ncbi:MAG: hypothetical protein JO100_08520 [Pseudonocardia sp.]|nr:hypothetical protein [Pseudonocardia sp.]